jgi:hypothetical protein
MSHNTHSILKMEHVFLAPWSLHQLGKYWGNDAHTNFAVPLPQPPMLVFEDPVQSSFLSYFGEDQTETGCSTHTIIS